MALRDALQYEIEGRLRDVPLNKCQVSVGYEAGPRIVRVGVCIDEYTWENREKVIDRLLAFEADHRDELAVDFDIIPLEAVNTSGFSEL